ncbi:unnamed protein product, partial [Mesorhabditis belari]|uniref:Glucuronosyltransferase n=1 Tax=Mesorhabditis belari TaxID=2138241 RepID=A0AAF3EZ62_9BILA
MKLIFLFFALLSASFAAKVAVFYLELSNSQILWNARVAETLIEGGHDVTLITIQPMSGLKRNVQIDPRIKEFIVEAKGNITVDEMERVQSELIFNEIPVWDKRSFGMLSMLSQIMGESCEKTILNKELFKFLEKEKFDVVFRICTIIAQLESFIWLGSNPGSGFKLVGCWNSWEKLSECRTSRVSFHLEEWTLAQE